MQKVTLQPGDYVATDDIKDEAEYHAIARAFMDAGAVDKGDAYWSKVEERIERCKLGWDNRDNELWASGSQVEGFTRQLTPAQILGDPQWVPEVGEECEIRVKLPLQGKMSEWKPATMALVHNGVVAMICNDELRTGILKEIEFRPLPTEEDRAVERLAYDIQSITYDGPDQLAKHLYHAGYRKQPQPAEEADLNDPANWRVGDVVECIDSEPRFCTKGKKYVVNSEHMRYGSQSVRIVADDDGDQGAPPSKSFRFYSRP